MYTEFFGLRETPFNSTLDPRFFFRSPQHEEALASLVYGVQERKGLVVVTGDVGTGKSFAGHMLVSRLGKNAETAVLNHSYLAGADLLQGICNEFQIPIETSYNTMEILTVLEEYLLTLYSKERAAVLVVDDAQTVSEKNLEHLRLVSNLEVADGKLLQIVLLGQRDLNQMLQKSGSKQLKQRVFRNFHITCLSRDLTERYIQHRLRTAGRPDARIFDDEALDLIFQYSNGVPRLINNLCDNVLLSAYSEAVYAVDGARVSAVIDEMMTMPDGEPGGSSRHDEVEAAISEITSQYVQSLESQIQELESTAADTDQRIHELHRMSSKLQAQELKFHEHQSTLDTKIRELHRLTVTLQEQERSLDQRDKALAGRVEEMRALSTQLDTQDRKLVEREARIAQQMRDLERISQQLGEQDHNLNERAGFIEKKLTSRQVSFDRELNECKRAINRKWQEIKNLVVKHETKEASRSKRLATLDQQLQRFEKIAAELSQREVKLDTVTQSLQSVEQATEHLQQLISQAGILLNQPQEIMARASRQMEQVERMTKIVQNASDVLQKTVTESLDSSRQLSKEGKALCARLEEIESDAVGTIEELEDRCTKTHKLRDVLREIYTQSQGQVGDLKGLVQEAEKAVAKLPKQLEQLRENTVHPTRLMKELRSIGSVAERNLQDGQVRLTELRAMIEKADKARLSIEALINATRRVADSRRSMPVPTRGEALPAVAVQRVPEPLTAKIESLSETVRRIRQQSSGQPANTPASPPVEG